MFHYKGLIKNSKCRHFKVLGLSQIQLMISSAFAQGRQFFTTLFIVNLIMSALVINCVHAKEEDPKLIVKNLVQQKRKKSIAMNYYHFYESYQANKSGSYYDDEAMLYAFGVSYEDNWYRGVLGWGYNLGLAQGVAVAGTSGNSRYYQTRVPFQVLSAGGRFFRRLNAFFEVGPSVVVQYKNMSWPEDSGYQVQAPQNPTLGVYIEFRSRINQQYDLFQKVGVLGKSKVAAWNLGFSYNWN